MLTHRIATPADARLLAMMNHQLIQDEGHRNPMTQPELEQRMRRWLEREYNAVLFEEAREVVAYALFRTEVEVIYLRQFFVTRERRRRAIGRQAVHLLLNEVFVSARRITLEVLASNQGARAFWDATGFRDYAITMELLRAPHPADFLKP